MYLIVKSKESNHYTKYFYNICVPAFFKYCVSPGVDRMLPICLGTEHLTSCVSRSSNFSSFSSSFVLPIFSCREVLHNMFYDQVYLSFLLLAVRFFTLLFSWYLIITHSFSSFYLSYYPLQPHLKLLEVHSFFDFESLCFTARQNYTPGNTFSKFLSSRSRFVI